MIDVDILARRMFAAYNEAAGGLTWDRKPIPPWEETGAKVQANWHAAAREAIAFVSERRPPCADCPPPDRGYEASGVDVRCGTCDRPVPFELVERTT